MGETGTSWGMDRGTRCPAVPPLACGAGTTCVGEEMEMTCGTWIFPAAAMVAWFSPPLQLMGEMETMVVVVVAPSVRPVSCCCCWLWKWAAGEAREATGTSWGHWDTGVPEGTSWDTGMPWMEGTTCGREKTCGEELQEEMEEMTELGGWGWESAGAKTTYSTCVAEVGVAGDTEEEDEEDEEEVKTSEGMALGQAMLGEEEEEDAAGEPPSGSKSTTASLPSAFAGREVEMTDGEWAPPSVGPAAASRCGCRLDLVIT